MAQLDQEGAYERADRFGMAQYHDLILGFLQATTIDLARAEDEVKRLRSRRDEFILTAHLAGIRRKYVLEVAAIGGQQHSNIIKDMMSRRGRRET